MAAQICETCKKKDARCYCAPNSTCEAYEYDIPMSGLIGAFEGKKIYAFYSPFTNHDNKDDAAVVAALSKEEAISKLRKYYANASEDNVKEVEFNRDDVCIICDTY